MSHIGELAAIGASFVWMLGGVIIERRSVGLNSNAINATRMALGLALATVVTLLTGQGFLPLGLPGFSWLMLFLSGVIGFAVGDSFLMRSFQSIGARITLLIYTLAPVITAVLGWALFGEKLTGTNILGMGLVITGIMLVVGLGKGLGKNLDKTGLIFAVLAAIGQSLGTVFSKLGLSSAEAFPATQIRLIGGLAGMGVILTVGRNWPDIKKVVGSVHGRQVILAGATLGTVIGVALSMVAIKNAKAAVAATLLSLMPVMILPISAFVLKEKLGWRDLTGAALSVLGTAVLFIQ